MYVAPEVPERSDHEGALQEQQHWTRGQCLLSPSTVPSAMLVRTNVSLEGRCGAVFLYKPEHRTHSVNLSCLWDPAKSLGYSVFKWLPAQF